MKILFTGGGTGGHIFPIIAIAREIKRFSSKQIELLFLGPKDELGGQLLSEEGIKRRTIWAGKIRRYLSPQAIFLNIVDAFKLLIGFFEAFFWLFLEDPDLVFSKGGYGAVPVVLAAKILQIPIFLHESDIVPGMANRIAAKIAIEIFVSFPQTQHFDPKKIIVVGNPVRKQIPGGSIYEAKKLLNLSEKKPVVLILGGSQGAQKINDLLLIILPELLPEFEVLHQCGKKNLKQVQAEAKVVVPKVLERYYHLFAFLNERQLSQAYFAADIIVARAGASNIFEIAACAKPSILIPYSHAAQNHQLRNAYDYAENGASLVIEEANLTPYFFLERLKFLISMPNELRKMSEAAKDFSRPKAAELIAHYLIEYLEMG